MPRPRVLSFMTQWGGGPPKSPIPSTPASPSTSSVNRLDSPNLNAQSPILDNHQIDGFARAGAATPSRTSRPPSVVNSPGTLPAMDPASLETPPELQPIFSYLSSHSNKLYQEGYFLKLHDLDSRGRPSTDRVWNECFAQLVGTVLSLWDAAQLDAAGEDGEVIPTFINLTDASIRMIESLPMNGTQGQSLQNVLSVSTAANNRYLLHFNSLHSLTQWTAGIRLAMYEHATLQESYTGSIIAGKGKNLNNVRQIMERARFPTEDWARVRFGAGTPWRRCWCVVTPPGEKEIAKAQKSVKKKSAYDRTIPVAKGDIKFYETRKITKKTKPIATITDAFSAYAIYPQSKPLIEQSTLVKIEGLITIHSSPPSTTEGFVFAMPEVHPAVTGFEMMLRFLVPVFDTFALYGRPTRLIADVLDPRSLMFGMPTQRRYGYLELIDVAGLIHTEGSQQWNEREWRNQMKVLTSKRITTQSNNPDRAGTMTSRRNMSRTSLNLPSQASRSNPHLPSTRNVRFGNDNAAFRSTPSSRRGSPAPPPELTEFRPVPRTDSSPALGGIPSPRHQRAASDAHTGSLRRQHEPSRLSFEVANGVEAGSAPPPPPPHAGAPRAPFMQDDEENSDRDATPDHEGYASGVNGFMPIPQAEPPQPPQSLQPVQPVQAPPKFAHNPSAQPPVRPNQMPDLRRQTSAIDAATLQQLVDANNRPRQEAMANGSQFGGLLHSQAQGASVVPQLAPPRQRSPQPPMQQPMLASNQGGPQPPLHQSTHASNQPLSQPPMRQPMQQQMQQPMQQSMQPPFRQPMQQFMPQSMQQQVRQPMQQSVQQPNGQSMQQSMQQQARQPMQQPNGQSMQQSMQQQIRQPMQQPNGQSMQQPNGQPMLQPMQQPVRQPIQMPAQPWGSAPVRTLPTIPGTPSAIFEGKFNLPEMLKREKSSGSITRKAVGSGDRRSYDSSYEGQ